MQALRKSELHYTRLAMVGLSSDVLGSHCAACGDPGYSPTPPKPDHLPPEGPPTSFSSSSLPNTHPMGIHDNSLPGLNRKSNVFSAGGLQKIWNWYIVVDLVYCFIYMFFLTWQQQFSTRLYTWLQFGASCCTYGRSGCWVWDVILPMTRASNYVVSSDLDNNQTHNLWIKSIFMMMPKLMPSATTRHFVRMVVVKITIADMNSRLMNLANGTTTVRCDFGNTQSYSSCYRYIRMFKPLSSILYDRMLPVSWDMQESWVGFVDMGQWSNSWTSFWANVTYLRHSVCKNSLRLESPWVSCGMTSPASGMALGNNGWGIRKETRPWLEVVFALHCHHCMSICTRKYCICK